MGSQRLERPAGPGPRPNLALARKGERVTSGAKGVGKDASIAELWSRAAHDLRQPVQAALLLSKMLDGASASPDMRRAARHIGASLNALYGMLEFLVVLSRLEAGLQSAPQRNCQLADVLAVTLREASKIAARRGVALHVRGVRGLVKSNPHLLATAIKSLLLNAIKFGSGDEITACCRRRGDQVAFEVRFKAAAVDPASETSAFFELSTPGAGASSCELGVGLVLLERLCLRLGHSLQQTSAPPTGRLLALWLPRPNRP
jgi:two-component system, sensor histidine kinase